MGSYTIAAVRTSGLHASTCNDACSFAPHGFYKLGTLRPAHAEPAGGVPAPQGVDAGRVADRSLGRAGRPLHRSEGIGWAARLALGRGDEDQVKRRKDEKA
jgi:hypothetical protein